MGSPSRRRYCGRPWNWVSRRGCFWRWSAISSSAWKRCSFLAFGKGWDCGLLQFCLDRILSLESLIPGGNPAVASALLLMAVAFFYAVGIGVLRAGELVRRGLREVTAALSGSARWLGPIGAFAVAAALAEIVVVDSTTQYAPWEAAASATHNLFLVLYFAAWMARDLFYLQWMKIRPVRSLAEQGLPLFRRFLLVELHCVSQRAGRDEFGTPLSRPAWCRFRFCTSGPKRSGTRREECGCWPWARRLAPRWSSPICTGERLRAWRAESSASRLHGRGSLTLRSVAAREVRSGSLTSSDSGPSLIPQLHRTFDRRCF